MQNFDKKIRFFYQNFDFCQSFYSGQKNYFSPKFQFFTKIFIFNQNFDFWPLGPIENGFVINIYFKNVTFLGDMTFRGSNSRKLIILVPKSQIWCVYDKNSRILTKLRKMCSNIYSLIKNDRNREFFIKLDPY